MNRFSHDPVYCACSNRQCMHVFYVVPCTKIDFDKCPKCGVDCYVHCGNYVQQFKDQEASGRSSFHGDGSRWEEI